MTNTDQSPFKTLEQPNSLNLSDMLSRKANHATSLIGSSTETGHPTTCERFNCITKFAYATSVGYNPNNPKKVNQDSYILMPNMMGKLGLHMFGVCDGHGANGHLVSQYIK